MTELLDMFNQEKDGRYGCLHALGYLGGDHV